ncbi:MAG: O-antigen ligase family protein, partial [Firmicutes bacterium]|nr:O-antigen ligase family protein [Bacillota bacterium]
MPVCQNDLPFVPRLTKRLGLCLEIAARVLTVLCFPLLIVRDIWNIGQDSPAAGLFCLLFELLLVAVFQSYKEPQLWLWALFFLWMGATSVWRGSDLLVAFGSMTPRHWLLSGLFFFTAANQSRRQRARWLTGIFAVIAATVTLCCISILWSNTARLLGASYEFLPIRGILVSGRLSAFGNPNSLAPIAAIGGACSVALLPVAFRNKKLRLPASLLLVFCLGTDLFCLALTRSRGTFVAFSCAAGLMAAVTVLERLPARLIRRLVCACLALILTAGAVLGALVLSKELYDDCISTIAQNRLTQAEAQQTEEALVTFGIDYAADTMTDRTLYWSAILRMMNDDPKLWLTGTTHPLKKTNMITGAYEGRPEKTGASAHNGYVDVLFTYGIPGAFLCFAMLCSWAYCGIRLLFRKDPSTYGHLLKACVAMAFMVMINGMVENVPFPSDFH